MKKRQFPIFAGLNLFGTKDSMVEGARKFIGTNNPRHLRVIHALMIRPRKRKEIDTIAGAANGPDLMNQLRRRGLRAKCEKVPGIDRDGRRITFGVYVLDRADRRAITAWLRKRDAGAKS
jgi:hypothetical protein